MKKNFIGIVLFIFYSFTAWAQVQKVSDFKDTKQRLAIVGFQNEFLDLSTEERIRNEVTSIVSRYSNVFSSREVKEMKIPENPNRRFFRPTRSELDESQLEFLKNLVKENNIDILMLGVVRESAEGFELELQLFDGRIQTLSGVEVEGFPITQRREKISKLIHSLMNYLDRDGFVHPAPQNFLAPYQETGVKTAGIFLPPDEEEFSLSPGTLGAGSLVGPVSIGGEQTPFWEKWWFWTIIGGALITGGSLSYYFLVVDQPPTKARLQFPLN